MGKLHRRRLPHRVGLLRRNRSSGRPSLRPEPGWFCIRCAPRREYALELRLLRKGFESLVPREVYWVPANKTDRRVHPERKQATRDRPWFPRLVFSRVQTEAAWVAIRATPFVQGVLSMDGRYYRLSDRELDVLYNVDGIQVAEPADPKMIRAGQKAKVSVGAFAGHPCEVQSIAGRRAKVLVMLFGSMTVAELPLASLEAA